MDVDLEVPTGGDAHRRHVVPQALGVLLEIDARDPTDVFAVRQFVAVARRDLDVGLTRCFLHDGARRLHADRTRIDIGDAHRCARETQLIDDARRDLAERTAVVARAYR